MVVRFDDQESDIIEPVRVVREELTLGPLYIELENVYTVRPRSLQYLADRYSVDCGVAGLSLFEALTGIPIILFVRISIPE